jgi:DNA polymerase III delta prime subunit
MENQIEWVDKYRPTKLKDYVLDADIKEYFKRMIKSKALQSMTFAGIAGSGKTTLAKLLCNEFDAEVLFVPCATDGTLDVLRTKITEFCNAMSFEGKPKIVILDEVDSASQSGQNNFQMALRTLIEAAQDDTRFILTCNIKEKVIPAVLSRCPIVPLRFDKKDLLLHVKKILDSEKIEYDKEGLKAFIEEAFRFYPDCRRIVKYLQFCANSGKLIVKLNAIVNSEKDDFIKDVVDKTISLPNILDVRKFYLANKTKLVDFIEGASLLFNYVVDNDLVDSDGILKLTDMLYQLNVVVDKEPTFFGMLVAIKRYLKNES